MALETPIWLQGGTYSARLDRSLLDVIFTEGVVDPGSGALLATQRAVGANDTVDVAVGAAVISGDDEPNQGKYYVRNTLVQNVAFLPAPGSDARIDLLVLQINDPTAGGSAGNNAVFRVIQGTVDVAPVAPAVPLTAIPLAEVLRTAADTTITDSMITDRRVASSTQTYTVNSQFEILTTAERDALVSPFAGQTIFNSTDDVVQVYDGTDWVGVTAATLGGLEDVDLAGLSDGDFLQYDNASGDWLAVQLPSPVDPIPLILALS